MIRHLLLLSFTALSFACASQSADRTWNDEPRLLALDGSSWKVKVRPDAAARAAGEKDFDDRLIFAGGELRSTACEPNGFAASAYAVETETEGLAFETRQESPKEGTSLWRGQVRGERIHGTMRWTKPDGSVLSYAFDGRAETAPTEHAAVPASAGRAVDWALNATIIEACSCPMFCQCYFNSQPAAVGCCPDDGDPKTPPRFCRFNNVFRVNRGHYGGADLAGAKFWVAGDLGGDFSQGEMNWAVLHFDPAVTPKQREGIQTALGALYPVKWQSFSVGKDAPIEWKGGKERSVARLDGGKMAEVVLEKNQGMSDEPIVIKNMKYWGAPRNEGFVLMQNEVEALRQVPEGQKPFEFKGTNGFMITFDIASKDVEKKS
jgi:hypothetical protein